MELWDQPRVPTLQLCMGPSYFWMGLTPPDPSFHTLKKPSPTISHCTENSHDRNRNWQTKRNAPQLKWKKNAAGKGCVHVSMEMRCSVQ